MTDLHFDMVQLVYILNKRQQFKDSTLQNHILGQSKKNCPKVLYGLFLLYAKLRTIEIY